MAKYCKFCTKQAHFIQMAVAKMLLDSLRNGATQGVPLSEVVRRPPTTLLV